MQKSSCHGSADEAVSEPRGNYTRLSDSPRNDPLSRHDFWRGALCSLLRACAFGLGATRKACLARALRNSARCLRGLLQKTPSFGGPAAVLRPPRPEASDPFSKFNPRKLETCRRRASLLGALGAHGFCTAGEASLAPVLRNTTTHLLALAAIKHSHFGSLPS
jgi:hypothetical protein